MRLTEISFPGQPPVDGYGPGFFRVGGIVHEGDLLVGAAGVTPWKGDWQALDPEQFDILLIGQGAEIAPLAGDARTALAGRSIAFEVMATPPAARTYNVLLSEGRRVAAVLIAV